MTRNQWPVSLEETESQRLGPAEKDLHGSRNTVHGSRIVTYREFVQSGLSPRMLAQGIAERSGRENICEVFLSPDAFAHRTAEASIAEQLGDVLIANDLPRPAPADDDRIGGWQFMYAAGERSAVMRSLVDSPSSQRRNRRAGRR